MGYKEIVPKKKEAGFQIDDLFTIYYYSGELIWIVTKNDVEVAPLSVDYDAEAAAAAAYPESAESNNEISAGQSMTADQKIFSPDGEHVLVLQTDGNVVIYNRDGQPIWASGTHSSRDPRFGDEEWKPVKMVFENGGELVL